MSAYLCIIYVYIKDIDKLRLDEMGVDGVYSKL